MQEGVQRLHWAVHRVQRVNPCAVAIGRRDDAATQAMESSQNKAGGNVNRCNRPSSFFIFHFSSFSVFFISVSFSLLFLFFLLIEMYM